MEPTDNAPDETEATREERQRGVGELFKEAWSQALVAVNATEDEVKTLVGRIQGWVEVGPDEARRLGTELTEKLRHQRSELEASVDSAVRKALTPFRLPSRDDVAELVARVDRLEERVARLNRKH